MKASFRVYIDESGDEGFVFKPDGSGSSKWLVLSALVTRRETDLETVKLIDRVRNKLGRKPRTPLHFRDLKHEQRLPYVREIASDKIHTVSVLIHKPSVNEPEKFQAEKYLLYRYASRMLLERVSWLCRDNRKENVGNGEAEVIFSNRSKMSYDELRTYLRTLKTKSDPLRVTIDWSVVNPDTVRAVNHEQLMGLQLADAVASSLYYAVNVNRYGDTEPRYQEILRPTFYRHKGMILGYGLKFWPKD
ncbi:MAG: DUF3800 domain-containing protein, partial [Verrucomicrobiota bacterium]